MATTTSDIGPVVVGLDGSDASLAALRSAVLEAGWRQVELHVIHALDVTPAVVHLAGGQTIGTQELAASDRDEVWKLAATLLDDSQVEMVKVERDGSPAKALSDYCDEAGASVLVVGPRGRGRVKKALLGSTAQSVIKTAPCDVLVVKS